MFQGIIFIISARMVWSSNQASWEREEAQWETCTDCIRVSENSLHLIGRTVVVRRMPTIRSQRRLASQAEIMCWARSDCLLVCMLILLGVRCRVVKVPCKLASASARGLWLCLNPGRLGLAVTPVIAIQCLMVSLRAHSSKDNGLNAEFCASPNKVPKHCQNRWSSTSGALWFVVNDWNPDAEHAMKVAILCLCASQFHWLFVGVRQTSPAHFKSLPLAELNSNHLYVKCVCLPPNLCLPWIPPKPLSSQLSKL